MTAPDQVAKTLLNPLAGGGRPHMKFVGSRFGYPLTFCFSYRRRVKNRPAGRRKTRPICDGGVKLAAPRSPRRRWPEVSQLGRTWLAGGADIVTKPSRTAVFIGAPARVGVPSLAPASRTTARSLAGAPLFSVAAAVRASRGSDAQGRRDCRSRRRGTCFG